DSHGNGQNLLVEKFPKNVRIIRSWPRPLGMMEGIDDSFAGAIFIGYHSSTTNQNGVRAHTKSSAYLADIRLNTKSMSETGINAAIAGHFNVPVIMLSGDDAIVKSATALLGPIETAEVKTAISFHSANTLTPEAANALIRDKVLRAMKRLDSFKPYKIETPITLEVTFKNYRPSQILAYLPIVKRVDAHSISYQADDMVAISRFLTFLTSYSISIIP
ncbi:MAG: M55 family metallopeptidase, partial [Calditrichaeota bacterium]|nr:M55 family metallopeptidase [Calditrichota bacterium]